MSVSGTDRAVTRTVSAAAVAALGLLVLSGAPAAAVQPTSNVFASYAVDDSHGSDADDGTPATWPEWAKTGGADDGHSDSHGDMGTDMDVDGQSNEGHGSEEHGGHGEEIGPPPKRPRALVLGSFAAANGGVLLTAAFLRRHTKNEVQRRKSARAAARLDTGHQPPSHVRSEDRSDTPSQP